MCFLIINKCFWAWSRENLCVGFRQSKTQTSLLSYRDQLEYWNSACNKFSYYTFQRANNTYALIILRESAGWFVPLVSQVFSRQTHFQHEKKALMRKLYRNFRSPDKRDNLKQVFLNFNICCGRSKEPSLWDGSFEHPKHMLITSDQVCLLGPRFNGCGVTILSFTIIFLAYLVLLLLLVRHNNILGEYPSGHVHFGAFGMHISSKTIKRNSVARSSGCHPTFITQYKCIRHKWW